MQWIELGLLACLAALSTASFAEGGAYTVDESKLPDWVKRAGNSPYKVIMDNAVVHIKAAPRAASGAASRKADVAAARTAATTPRVAAPTAAAPPAVAAPSSPALVAAVARTSAPEAPTATPMPASKPTPEPAFVPPPPLNVAALKPSAAPAPVAPPTIGRICPTQTPPEMPRAAADQGIGGTVKVRATVQGGVVREVAVLSGPTMFRGAVLAAMRAYRCLDSAEPVSVEQAFVFEAR